MVYNSSLGGQFFCFFVEVQLLDSVEPQGEAQAHIVWPVGVCNVRAEKKISMAIWVPKKSKILHLCVCVCVCLFVCVFVCVCNMKKIKYHILCKKYILLFFIQSSAVKNNFFMVRVT